MNSQDTMAEKLSELLDEPLSRAELAHMVDPAAAEARTALDVWQALQDMQPDGQFVAQLEARLLATLPQSGVASTGFFPLDWLRGAIPTGAHGSAAHARPRRWALAVSGSVLLLALFLAAAILVPLLGHNKQGNPNFSMPVQQGLGVAASGLSSYILSDTAILPVVPARVPLFRESTEPWSADTTHRVAALAAQLGLRDPFTVTMDQDAVYFATDGVRLMSVNRDRITYQDSSVRGPSDLKPGVSVEEARRLAEQFFRGGGYLDFPYRAVVQGGGDTPAEVFFVRLADGRPVQNENGAFDARALVVGNRIADAGFISHTLEPAGDTSIITAEEAWQALQQNRVLIFRLFTAGVTQQTTRAVSTPQAQPRWPTPVAPPVGADGKVNGIMGRLSAVIYEYPGVVSSTQQLQVSLSEWLTRTGSAGRWNVELRGTGLPDLAQYDGLRVKVWGRYDAGSRTVDVEHYEKADPTERVQAWLGVVTSTVMGDGVMRSFFTTQDGRRFLISDSLICPPAQTVCLTNVPTDRVVIVEGTFGQDTFDGIPVLYLLSAGGGVTDMTERDLSQRPARPYIVPVATSAPQPTALAPHTPPYQPGDSVEGVEGYLHAWLYQDAQGRIVSVNAELSVLPLTGNTWGARLGEGGQQPLLRDLAQYDGLRVRLWGHFTRDVHDQPLINVERYEKVDPAEHVEAWLGTLITGTVQGRTVLMLQTRAGERFVLAVRSSLFSPAYISDQHNEQLLGKQVVQEGVLRPEQYGGYRIIQDGVQSAGVDIDRMTDLKDYKMQPHPFVSVVVNPGRTGVVEQVELVYYSSPGEGASPVTLRPAWRFSGYTSDGGLFEALVDAVRQDTARVTLDAFSGQPNPLWTLDSASTSDLKALLAAGALSPTIAASAVDGALGYRGLLIDLTDANTGVTQHFRVFNGVVARQGAAWSDPQRRLERWLLRSGVGWFDNVLYAQLSQAMDAGLPQVWEDVAVISDLSTDMPKPYQLHGSTFFLILIEGQPVALSAKDPHPRGCPIVWSAEWRRLTEPCLGSYYDLHGVQGGGPSPRDMDRFPARLNGTRVEVDVTRVIDGTFRAQAGSR